MILVMLMDVQYRNVCWILRCTSMPQIGWWIAIQPEPWRATGTQLEDNPFEHILVELSGVGDPQAQQRTGEGWYPLSNGRPISQPDPTHSSLCISLLMCFLICYLCLAIVYSCLLYSLCTSASCLHGMEILFHHSWGYAVTNLDDVQLWCGPWHMAFQCSSYLQHCIPYFILIRRWTLSQLIVSLFKALCHSISTICSKKFSVTKANKPNTTEYFVST